MSNTKTISKVDQPWTIREYFSFEQELQEQIRFCRILGNNIKYLRNEYFIAIDNLALHWLNWMSDAVRNAIAEFWTKFEKEEIDVLQLYDAIYIILLYDINKGVNLLTKSPKVSRDEQLTQNKK